MNVTVHSFDQYSPEWDSIRCGRITASEAGPYMIGHADRDKKARHSYICELLAERAGHVRRQVYTDDIKRGNALEEHARRRYELITGNVVTEVGFISHNTLPAGCSPDGLVDDDAEGEGGIEIKCPGAGKHTSWLLAGVLPGEHEYQVHMSLALSGRKWWDFFSYCPIAEYEKRRDEWQVIHLEEGWLMPFLVRIYPTKLTELISDGLERMSKEYAEQESRMAEILERQANR